MAKKQVLFYNYSMALLETDSFRLSAYVQGPQDSERLALVLPGFLDSKDATHMRSHVDALGHCGYLAASFDAPGTWGSGNNDEDYNSTNYLGAIDELIGHFGNRPTLLMGHSMGGRIALLSAMQNENVDSLVAAMALFRYIRPDTRESRIVRWQAEGTKTFKATSPLGQERTYHLPYSYSEDAQSYDIRSKDLPGLVIPKLFLVGECDQVVTAEEAEMTYQSLGKPKQWHSLKTGHFYSQDPEALSAINLLISNFARR